MSSEHNHSHTDVQRTQTQHHSHTITTHHSQQRYLKRRNTGHTQIHDVQYTRFRHRLRSRTPKEHSSHAQRDRIALLSSWSLCMEKGFATLPVNSTQAVATVAVRIWFGSHASVTEGPVANCRLFLDDGTPFGVSLLLEPLRMRVR